MNIVVLIVLVFSVVVISESNSSYYDDCEISDWMYLIERDNKHNYYGPIFLNCSNIDTLHVYETYDHVSNDFPSTSHFRIDLYNVSIVDISAKRGQLYARNHFIYLTIYDSNLLFKYNDFIVNESNVNEFIGKPFVFDNSGLTQLDFVNVKFQNSMPDIMFEKASIDCFTFINTSIRNAIIETNETNFPYVYTGVPSQMYIKNPTIPFDTRDLNAKVFGKLNVLELSDTPVEFVGEDFSYKFPNLTSFSYNPKPGQKLGWLKNLNLRQPYNFTSTFDGNQSKITKFLKLRLMGNDSLFLDESNFCSFKDYPHDQLVFPDIYIQEVEDFVCSCTVYWLYKNYENYPIKATKSYSENTPLSFLMQNVNIIESCLENLTQKIDNCDFEARLRACNGIMIDNFETIDTVNYTQSNQNAHTHNTSCKLSINIYISFLICNFYLIMFARN